MQQVRMALCQSRRCIDERDDDERESAATRTSAAAKERRHGGRTCREVVLFARPLCSVFTQGPRGNVLSEARAVDRIGRARDARPVRSLAPRDRTTQSTLSLRAVLTEDAMSATRRRSAIPASPAGTLVSKIYVYPCWLRHRNDDRAGVRYPTAIRNSCDEPRVAAHDRTHRFSDPARAAADRR